MQNQRYSQKIERILKENRITVFLDDKSFRQIEFRERERKRERNRQQRTRLEKELVGSTIMKLELGGCSRSPLN